MMKFRDKKGFSLVELMIVVAIIAILAAIAIPSFLRFAMRSKTAEATSNLAGIRTAEEGYWAENDVYLACPTTTAGTTYPDATPDAGGEMWVATAAGNFTPLGFQADGVVRYAYEVVINVADAVPFFTATADGDLDDEGGDATYMVTKNAAETATTGDAVVLVKDKYPKACHVFGTDDF